MEPVSLGLLIGAGAGDAEAEGICFAHPWGWHWLQQVPQHSWLLTTLPSGWYGAPIKMELWLPK